MVRVVRILIHDHWDLFGLTTLINDDMPVLTPESCTGDCASILAEYILSWVEEPFIGETLWAINVGGGAFIASDGQAYSADSNSNNAGNAATTSDSISGTEDDTIFRSERWGADFSYELPVSPGEYNVILHFVELYWSANNSRVQDVYIEGERVRMALDIHSEVGHDSALSLEFNGVNVSDDGITIRIVGTEDNASLSGIRVVSAAPPYAEFADDPLRVGPKPLRRLTRREYDNTIQDLLFLDDEPSVEFSFPSDRDFEFEFPIYKNGVASLDLEKIMAAAEALAMRVNINLLKPCNSDSRTCATEFIQTFGKRAFRRPLVQVEIDRLLAVYDAGRADPINHNFDEALRLLVEVMLQSAPFLYHWELGTDSPLVDGDYIKLNPYEIASRLSYFIWRSMPDETLLAAAENGQLNTAAGIDIQAQRLLESEKAREAVSSFFEYWLGIAGLEGSTKNTVVYPEFDAALKSSMLEETRAFAASVIFDGDASFDSLMTSNHSFVNEPLAALYDLNGITGVELRPTSLNNQQRGGLLTLSAFLSGTGGASSSLPPKRGATIYEKVLCRELPPPPANVPEVEPPTAGGTTRDRFEAHAELPCAAACHGLFDPIGFAFEHYGGIGEYRLLDNGLPVDATGHVILSSGQVQFDGAMALSQVLADSQDAQQCFATHWLRYGLGRHEYQGLDDPTFSAVQAEFINSGGDIKQLIRSIVQSRSFRFRVLSIGEVQ